MVYLDNMILLTVNAAVVIYRQLVGLVYSLVAFLILAPAVDADVLVDCVDLYDG